MRIAVMGTGGVGGYFGALLARAGHDVTFVARGAHLAAIQQHGLRVESTLDGMFTVTGKAVQDTTQAGPQDLVLFTVKMYDNASALAATAPLLGDETVILTLQNGIDNGDQLAEQFGATRILIGSAYMEGRVKEPGVVTQAGPGAAAFGEMVPGLTSRAQRLLHVFREAGWRVELHENMPGMLWKKFAYIAGSAAVCAATNSDYQEMRSIPETRALIEGAIAEALAVGRARGAPIMEDSLAWSMAALDQFPGTGRASLAKDFLAGNRVELDGLTGAVIRLARSAGVPTPMNDALYAILKPWALRIEAQRATHP
ncbi:MAG: ketopantoate reductase family protein [Candidatus Tectomicrobia bacterium]|uniref:2-dehydropantoate 2-reductase n=1 Tax=Tectimicrobiota bacterium TaxID=2528274 RepID=A0A937W3Y4_UNCTE|nr:ketopantoate reductase family protein [Candidatus Tectomicrobia bacterium]